MKNILLRSRLLPLAASLLLAAPALWSCNSQTALQKQLADHENQLKIIDEDTIQSYLRRNNLTSQATRTNSGLYVVNVTSGTGTPVTAGRSVRVKYIGRFLSNGAHPESSGYPASGGNSLYPQGAIFNNTADNRTACGCLVYTAGGAIEGSAGFGEGLLLMRQGDRKLLLVPSRLGYGAVAQSNIPADAALMFDVEVLEVFKMQCREWGVAARRSLGSSLAVLLAATVANAQPEAKPAVPTKPSAPIASSDTGASYSATYAEWGALCVSRAGHGNAATGRQPHGGALHRLFARRPYF